MLATRGAPKLEACLRAEHEQRLTDCAGGAVYEQALSPLHMARAVKKLVRGGPAQNHPRGLRRIDSRRHADNVGCPEGAIGGVRSQYRHVSHSIAELESAYAGTELIDFADDIVSEHERQVASHRLRVEVSADYDVGVLQARGEHTDAHLARSCCRQRSVPD